MFNMLRATIHAISLYGAGIAILISLTICAGLAPAARAQTGTSALVEKINANTLTVLTAGSGLTYGAFASDLATVLNDGDEFRILPVQGHSAFQNVRDVRYLRGIDMGFIQSNVLGNYRRKGLIPDLKEKIVYVFKVCNNEIHIIARSDITSVEQLRGKKVNFNQVDSGAQISAQDLFSYLGVEVQEVNLRQNDALEKLKTGEIAATIALAGKPAPPIAKLKAKDGYRILPIPFDKRMLGDFVPTTFTHDDYPDLVPAGQTVETVASGTVLIAFNWPKGSDHYQRIDKFVKAFFPRLAEFHQPPRHEKWKETVLSAELPGWKRFEGAEEWIRQAREDQIAARRGQFEQFLAIRNVTSGRAKTMQDSDRNQLFEDFVRWSATAR
jgi:TRAP transporter TAXI family solute receptor